MAKNKKKEDIEEINPTETVEINESESSEQVKPVDETINETVPEVKPVDEKVSNSIEIEITKEVAGMKIGTVKTVPALWAKQMIERGNAKQTTK